MDDSASLRIDDRWIRSLRGNKNKVDPSTPYSLSLEKERDRSGKIVDTAAVFLTNRECPFTCLMCDLWKYTTDNTVGIREIIAQVENVLPQIQQAVNIKLYNSGNFFDKKAIPETAYSEIAGRLKKFKTLTVECHPRLIDERVLRFRDMLQPDLEVAMGLETSNPFVLSRLNKNMNLQDFSRAARFLTSNGINVRAFILLKPPFLGEKEGILWAKRSIDFAFQCGVECCVVIPVRTGNGALEWLRDNGYFSQPSIESLEEVLEYGLTLNTGRVFADLWDLERLSTCKDCFEERKSRLNQMNLSQQIKERVACHCREDEPV